MRPAEQSRRDRRLRLVGEIRKGGTSCRPVFRVQDEVLPNQRRNCAIKRAVDSLAPGHVVGDDIDLASIGLDPAGHHIARGRRERWKRECNHQAVRRWARLWQVAPQARQADPHLIVPVGAGADFGPQVAWDLAQQFGGGADMTRPHLQRRKLAQPRQTRLHGQRAVQQCPLRLKRNQFGQLRLRAGQAFGTGCSGVHLHHVTTVPRRATSA